MRRFVVLGIAALFLAASMLISSSSGALPIPLRVTLRALGDGIWGRRLSGNASIVWSLRLPRVCLAALVGASLGGSGAALQGLFRNPLADPYLLGVASGASFGATLALVAGDSLPSAFAEGGVDFGGASRWVPLAASLGAGGATLLTLALARGARHDHSGSLLLSGTVVGSVLVSLTTYLMMRDADRLRAVFAWTLGNLSGASWRSVGLSAPYCAAGLGVLFVFSRGLDALQLGEDTARTLGLHPARIRVWVVLGASVATAACVSFAGVIGFVGLVAPHVMRRLGASQYRFLIPGAALAGAALLVTADLLARTLTRPAELPVGIVTTMLGGPFFLWLLRRKP